MKKFLKIVLFGILTLSLINISNTKINYLNNNNEVEKVKSPRKNVNVDVNSIHDLTDLSNTTWYQISGTNRFSNTAKTLYSLGKSKVKFCDIINKYVKS